MNDKFEGYLKAIEIIDSNGNTQKIDLTESLSKYSVRITEQSEIMDVDIQKIDNILEYAFANRLLSENRNHISDNNFKSVEKNETLNDLINFIYDAIANSADEPVTVEFKNNAPTIVKKIDEHDNSGVLFEKTEYTRDHDNSVDKIYFGGDDFKITERGQQYVKVIWPASKDTDSYTMVIDYQDENAEIEEVIKTVNDNWEPILLIKYRKLDS
jgi:hypothetical protein